MATWSMIKLQDANSPIMEQMVMFHDHSMMILLTITVIVSYLMVTITFNKIINRNLLEGQTIELMWTIMPAVTLVFIALPSLRLLYMMDEMLNPMLTVKAIGHQWYWSYEYSDLSMVEFDSYMKPSNDLEKSDFRLLDVDNRTVLPMNTQIRVLVTATDVLHSWAMPSLGIKIDATPGRMNQGSIMMNRPGLMFGQCSEICGANHSFMPIVIESVSMKTFLEWIKTN
uniref:Cytochrome c oxidase subunit 2 n=1 Tax=Ilyocoris cimicoides TaxID=280203 RepID=C5HIR5_9HEMI|nr:cytochrome c oxidase subunit II [Ilyocoris cimicoides]ACJ69510.1 cytochrome c oxidase subunit II [Ilyocoris cimicoides]